jgi:hypothetical protein
MYSGKIAVPPGGGGIVEITRIVCNSNNSVQNYCMQECLFYLSEGVMYDFNNYKIKYF